MTKIYLISVINAVYNNNKIEKILEKSILYAEDNEEKAKKDKERIEEKSLKERTEWFKNHDYGIFPIECNYEEIDLY